MEKRFVHLGQHLSLASLRHAQDIMHVTLAAQSSFNNKVFSVSDLGKKGLAVGIAVCDIGPKLELLLLLLLLLLLDELLLDELLLDELLLDELLLDELLLDELLLDELPDIFMIILNLSIAMFVSLSA
jgi:hypothetical protein